MEDKENLLTIQEAACYLGVSTTTLRKWTEEAKDDVLQITSKHELLTSSELDKLIALSAQKRRKGKFSPIERFLISNAARIEKNATQQHIEYLGEKNLRSNILKKYNKRHVQLLIAIAYHLNFTNLSKAAVDIRQVGNTFGKQAVQEGITIEEAVDGILFLKQMIWKEIKDEDTLQNFSIEDFYQLSQVVGTLIDTLTSQITFTYYEQFKKAEKEQYTLGAIVNSSEDAIVSKNLNSIIQSWNISAEKLFGWTAKEVIGKSITIIIPPELQKEEAVIIKNIKAGKRIEHFETVRVKKNGKRVMISLSISPIKDRLGNIIGAAKIARDITKQKITEKQLQEQARLLQAVTDAILVQNSENKIMYWNEGASKMYGWTSEEAKNKTAYTLLKTRFPIAIEEIHKQLKREKLWHGELIHITKDGRKIIVDSKWELLDDTKEYTVLEVNRDITQRKEAEAIIEKEKNQFQMLIDSIPVMISIYGPQVNIIYFNKYLEHLTGWTTDEAQKGNVLERIYPDKKIREEVLTFMNSLQRGWKDIPMTTKNGKTIESTWQNIRLPSGIKIGIGIDIGERKKLEQQRQEFLGVASHELKTPVTSIKAYTQILQQVFKKRGDEKSAELLTKMDGQLNKLTTLISDLLDVTRIQSGKLQFHEEYFDFNTLVEEIVDEIQHTAPRHTISMSLEKSKTVYGDRDRIGQVITNLLTNAVKYSPHAKEVIVTTKTYNKNITLCVEDFGVGIPKHLQLKIFEQFYRVEGQRQDIYPGLGLGLYISQEIVRRQQGDIWVESRESKGSTFCFALPMYKRKISQQNAIAQEEIKV